MRLDHQERIEDKKRVNIPSLIVEGRSIATDDQGFLLDFNDWSPAVAEALAAADGVELQEDHWTLIGFLHRFYKEYEIAPQMPVLSRNLCKDQQNCRWSRPYIKQLFPDGARTACRYAGLPAPVGTGCL